MRMVKIIKFLNPTAIRILQSLYNKFDIVLKDHNVFQCNIVLLCKMLLGIACLGEIASNNIVN